MRFATLIRQPDDPLLKIIGQHAADPRPDKIDLGVGVFRDEEGRTPVMTAVKAAEARLLETQVSKSYLGPEGDIGFVHALGRIVIGEAVPSDRYVGLQTPGGTGALRLAAEVLARAGVARVWIAKQKMIPVVDLAYQGLGDGFDVDAVGARAILAAVPEALLAYSCDKNFGLYRERTGALFAIVPDADAGTVVLSNLLALARANWSMPPDHGAAIVRIILEDEALTREWYDELEAMRARLAGLRARLAEGGRIGTIDLAAVAHGKGMFATLPLSPAQVEWLRDRHGIYMAGSGRINIAGFNTAAIGRFHDALRHMAANGVV